MDPPGPVDPHAFEPMDPAQQADGHRHVNELGVTERLIAGYDDRL